MKTLYFDAFSGASGDMILGALLDAGLSLDALRAELGKLPVAGYALEARQVVRHGIAAVKADVMLETHHGHPHAHAVEPAHEHHHRGLSDILELIQASTLPEADQDRAGAVFRRLAEAEAKVHQCTVDEIHFHEVGAVDAIVDIVGAVVGLRLLGVEQVLCSPLRTGTGFVDCAHGRIPVPAPATVELLRGFPSAGSDVEGELTTPTGAAILTTLADAFGPRPTMSVQAIGYGAGGREREDVPNLLRVFLGEADPVAGTRVQTDEVTVIEANLDDLSPEITGYVVERLLEAGALDAFLSPVMMKKGRPGVVLTVLAEPSAAGAIEDLILTETSSFGVRRTRATRRKLLRHWLEVDTRFGAIRIKIGRLGDKVVQAAPEYEDCRAAAIRCGVPLRDIYRATIDAYRRH